MIISRCLVILHLNWDVFLQSLTWRKVVSPWIHCWKFISGSCIPSCRSSQWFGVTEHVMPCRETNDGTWKGMVFQKGSTVKLTIIMIIMIIYKYTYINWLLGKPLEVAFAWSMEFLWDLWFVLHVFMYYLLCTLCFFFMYYLVYIYMQYTVYST